MTYSFNLVDRKWIPCVHFDGRVEEFSLREALTQAHTLRGIQGDSPLETAALYRLLLAVLHSALRGPCTKSEWAELWEGGNGSWDKPWLLSYLDTWKSRFDLFDPEKPFYQVRDSRVKPKTALQLLHGMGTANELFEHISVTEDVRFSPAQAARMLIAGQVFGIGGGCDPSQNLYLSSGSWRTGVVFLIEGENVFQSLALNLLRYADDRPIPKLGKDLPAWEMDDPFSPNREQPIGYLDYLTWQNRRLFLFPEEDDAGRVIIWQMTIAPGLAMAGDLLHPMKQFSAGKKGWNPLEFREGKSLWRNSHTLLALKKPDKSRPPQSFEWLSTLMTDGHIELQRVFRCMTLGMACDRAKAKIYFYSQEHFPLPLAYLEEEKNELLVEELANALALNDLVLRKLRGAIFNLAKFILSPNADQSNGRQPDTEDINNLMDYLGFERNYWGALEIPFWHLLEGLPINPETVMSTWKDILKETAWNTLEKAADLAGDNVHALKAAVRARGTLGYSLKELFPETEKEATA
ncbi:MAG: type I-E CRISPR-associated protein Cse1/CasA [Chloroflexota bacterium]